MKLTLLICAFFLTFHAQAFSKYYGNVSHLSGYKLKTHLSKVLKGSHIDRGYTALFNAYTESDRDVFYDKDGSIVDMYSENPKQKDPYTFNSPKKKCGSYKKESDCYNREHLFPQSAFNKRYPMRSDIFHVYPSDGKVNNRRGSYAFGEVGKPIWKSKNGSKLGLNRFENRGNMVFEPIDEFKGDIARALFYFATRYEDKMKSFDHEWLDGSCNQVYKPWFVRLLLKWHKMDPVSAHEQNRNNAGYSFQGNRNPYIDHPEWVEKIWSAKKTSIHQYE